MNNREKYRFDDFTLSNYERLLDIALEQGYVFSDYRTSFDDSQGVKEIVWRHDVEFSVHRALKIAQIEHAKGLKAHYFFQIHCEFYNIFEKEIFGMAKQIQGLGHYIGLHFDAHFWEVSSVAHLEECISSDRKILEDLLSVEIKSFSFHNTTPALLSMNDLYYGGLLNVYAKLIREKYQYCTDSTGIWRYERLEDVLFDDSIKYLQVLTHDGMWQDDAMAPRQRVLKCINLRALRIQEYYDKHLPLMGQLNVDDYDG
jgi:hypothetical protein